MSDVTISLTQDEALVLFEFLSRFDQTDELAIQDPEEERALWNLHASFEKTLVEPFLPDYPALLEKARAHLRGS